MSSFPPTLSHPSLTQNFSLQHIFPSPFNWLNSHSHNLHPPSNPSFAQHFFLLHIFSLSLSNLSNTYDTTSYTFLFITFDSTNHLSLPSPLYKYIPIPTSKLVLDLHFFSITYQLIQDLSHTPFYTFVSISTNSFHPHYHHLHPLYSIHRSHNIPTLFSLYLLHPTSPSVTPLYLTTSSNFYPTYSRYLQSLYTIHTLHHTYTLYTHQPISFHFFIHYINLPYYIFHDKFNSHPTILTIC